MYAHGYLFSRYLANQTRGLPGGGDSVYRSVFDAMRDERGLGQCTSESLMAALDNIGYAGVGDECAVAQPGRPCPRLRDGAFPARGNGPAQLGEPRRIQSVHRGRVGSSPAFRAGTLQVAARGGSATIASLAASGAPDANAGSGTQTTFATSSLPVSYKIAANPSSGPVKPGSQIALSSPQLASLPGAHYEVATLTTYEQILNLSAPFLPLEDPLLFEPGVLAYAVRIASDRGTTPHTVFGFYETAEPDEGEGDQGDDPPGGGSAFGRRRRRAFRRRSAFEGAPQATARSIPTAHPTTTAPTARGSARCPPKRWPPPAMERYRPPPSR